MVSQLVAIQGMKLLKVSCGPLVIELVMEQTIFSQSGQESKHTISASNQALKVRYISHYCMCLFSFWVCQPSLDHKIQYEDANKFCSKNVWIYIQLFLWHHYSNTMLLWVYVP